VVSGPLEPHSPKSDARNRSTYGGASQLYLALKLVAKVGHTVFLGFGQNGLDARCISPDQVFLATLNVPPSAFTEWSHEDHGFYETDLGSLLEALEYAAKGWVQLTVDARGSSGTLTIGCRYGDTALELRPSDAAPPDLKVVFEAESLVLIQDLVAHLKKHSKDAYNVVGFHAEPDALYMGIRGSLRRLPTLKHNCRVDQAEA
jgi:hypothetical protein